MSPVLWIGMWILWIFFVAFIAYGLLVVRRMKPANDPVRPLKEHIGAMAASVVLGVISALVAVGAPWDSPRPWER